MENEDYRSDKLKNNAIAFLVEFYSRGIVERFCGACSDFHCDITDAVASIKYIVMQNLALEEMLPDFPDLAVMYARSMEIDEDAFAQYFYIPRQNFN